MRALSRLLKRSVNKALLRQLETAFTTAFAIRDSTGVWAYGKPIEDVTVTPIETVISLKGQERGVISSDRELPVVADVVQRLLTAEEEKRALGEEILDSYRELNLFYKLSKKLHSCLDYKAVAQLTLEEVCPLVHASQASIMNLAKDGNLEVVASHGRQSPNKVRLRLGEGIAGTVFQTGEAELITDASEDARFVNNVHNVQSLMCVPIKVEDKVLGLLNVSSRGDKQFTAQDLKLATAVAEQAGAWAENSQLQQQRLENDRVQRHLQRYIAPQVMDSLLTLPADEQMQTLNTPVTALFADIRGFTGLCETHEATAVVEHLNNYFSSMVDIVFAHEGTLDKFVGDMLFCFFNAPQPQEAHQRRAVETAIAMQQSLLTAEDEWIRDNFTVGIGINTGPAIVGNIGSPIHSDYTAIGDTINLGARLQAMATGGQILVSQSVYDELRETYKFRPYGEVPVKGKKDTVAVFEVCY